MFIHVNLFSAKGALAQTTVVIIQLFLWDRQKTLPASNDLVANLQEPQEKGCAFADSELSVHYSGTKLAAIINRIIYLVLFVVFVTALIIEPAIAFQAPLVES